MTSDISLSVGDRRCTVPRGTRVGEILDGKRGQDVVAARVNGKLVDLSSELREDARIEPVAPDSPDGLAVIRHSTAHLMAMAVQQLYPATQVTIGPTIEDGFYYDFAPPRPFNADDLPAIEARMRELAQADYPIERLEESREEAIKRFEAMSEQYKVELLKEIPDETVSIYRQGPWLDLCRGPHVPSTGCLRNFKLTGVAGAYWRGDEHNPMLSRIYGTAFASQAALTEHLEMLELARQRDHRKLGREMDLFIFDPLAPGSPFFLPRGAVIYNELIAYVRRLYRRYGFEEVITPQIFRNELWRKSGHWENFREQMFLTTDAESEGKLDYAVKPMNCPGHCLVYGSQKRSYRDLPLRLADFGRLHRAERSGVLHGLTRVRVMAQDDAHIYCTEEQVGEEIDLNIRMIQEIYGTLGFERPEFKLATMPEKHMGTEQMWQATEKLLAEALSKNRIEWEFNPGEGAFYGPKIEFYVADALKRKWQLATIQLDFNMPERFGLRYTSKAGSEERPVMIHRAILGSLERFIGVLIEHTGGVLPFWLAPEQGRVLSLSEKVENYASEVADLMRKEGFRVSADLRNEKLGLKVREAELAKVPYMVVVGEREAQERSVSLRMLRGAKNRPMELGQLLELLKSEPLPG